jgi:hypothetical protein
MRDFNSLLSRGLNALRGSTGSNVEKGYNIVNPTDEARVVEHAVYTLTNPCKDGLVERAADWEGVTSLGLDYGQPITVRRPSQGLWKRAGAVVAKLLQKGSSTTCSSEGSVGQVSRTSLPETVELVLERPPVLLEHSDATLRELIRAEVRRVEDEHVIERRHGRRGVMGMRRVRSQWYTDTPETPRAIVETTPRVSGRTRARLDALRERFAFERAYAIARDAIAAVLAEGRALGARLATRLATIELPQGTFLLRRRYGELCGSTS